MEVLIEKAVGRFSIVESVCLFLNKFGGEVKEDVRLERYPVSS